MRSSYDDGCTSCVNAHGHADVGWSLRKANQAGGAPAASAWGGSGVVLMGAGNPLKVPPMSYLLGLLTRLCLSC